EGNELYVTVNTYDSYGNLRHIIETYPGGNLPSRSILNAYDAANRLILEHIGAVDNNYPSTQTAYTYDTANNRTAKTVTVDGALNSAHTYTYNGLNQLLTSTDAVSGASSVFAYDRNGNRISRMDDTDANGIADQSVRYLYDRENRLIE